jgi:amino acid transporter
MATLENKQNKHKSFGLYSFISLVVTSVVGADIYIIISQTADLTGIQSIWAWVICGVFALIIAFCYAQCANLVPETGGTYIYIEKAFGRFPGFLTGWILYISEWFALVVYPLAFLQYIHYFVPASPILDVIFKISFILILVAVNVRGTRSTAKVDNILTVLKVVPLLILIIVSGLWVMSNGPVALAHLGEFKTEPIRNFNEVILLVFWAFAGFELSVVPSSEVDRPKKLVPEGLVIGIILIIVFFILINLSVFVVLDKNVIAGTQLPLAGAMSFIFQNQNAGLIIIFGGLISICGIALATVFELSRLLQKMAKDGYVSRIFAKQVGKENVPIYSVIIPPLVAMVISLFADVRTIIGFSVVLLAIIYCLTGIANWKLHSMAGKKQLRFRVVSILTIVFSLVLFASGTLIQLGLSMLVIVLGVVWYYLKVRK